VWYLLSLPINCNLSLCYFVEFLPLSIVRMPRLFRLLVPSAAKEMRGSSSLF
jgi:hypothetical protein